MQITADHVKELATLFGETVLVPMPCEHPPAGSLWVISTDNKHYEGAETVYATGEQVTDMIPDDEQDELTDATAEKIAEHLTFIGRDKGIQYARQLKHPEGYSARVLDELSQNPDE